MRENEWGGRGCLRGAKWTTPARRPHCFELLRPAPRCQPWPLYTAEVQNRPPGTNENHVPFCSHPADQRRAAGKALRRTTHAALCPPCRGAAPCRRPACEPPARDLRRVAARRLQWFDDGGRRRRATGCDALM